MYLNRIEIIGRLGRAPEIKEGARTRAGLTVCTSRKFKKPDGTYGEVKDWHIVTAWGKLAELIGGFNLGSGVPVYVAGEMRYTSYEDKEGITRTKAEIVASEVQVLNTRAERGDVPADVVPEQKKTTRKKAEPSYEDVDDSDLPF